MSRHLFAGLGGLASLAVLAGCASQQEPEPLPIINFGWFYAQTPGEGAKLVYGQEGTDNVTLMLICRPRSGRVEITLSGDKAGAVQLMSGRLAARVVVRPPEGEGMDSMLIGALRADNAVLAAFVRGGDLAIIDGGHRTPLPVRPAERRLAAEFLAACRPA